MIASAAPAFFPGALLSTPRLLGRSSEKKLWNPLEKKNRKQGRRGSSSICRAELALDAPFAAAIGACVLNSLVFPVLPGGGGEEDEDGGGGAMDSTDMRFAVMGIVSFIPYFNWLSWVFAWMDSGRQRYLVYSIVYLLPYLRTNLSLSPEESWLPIVSILVCILHIQLEASIRNGDFKGIHFLSEALKLVSTLAKQKDSVDFQTRGGSTKKGKIKRHMKLPSRERSQKDIREWEIPKKPNHGVENSNEYQDVDGTDNELD